MLNKELRIGIVRDAKKFGLYEALKLRKSWFAMEACFYLMFDDYEKAKECATVATYLDKLQSKEILLSLRKLEEEVKNG